MSKKKYRVLYAGDSGIPGPANYLVAVLNSMPHIEFKHVPPGKKITKSLVAKHFDAYLLSDFAKADLPLSAEKEICRHVDRGAGLFMIGGWGSFSGPFGGWRGSEIAKRLPVECLKRDDRINYAQGSVLCEESKHVVSKALLLSKPPVICGFNEVKVKRGAQMIYSARKISYPTKKMTLAKKKYPLLVVSRGSESRRAALTTDFAPHWCGGMVDWGRKHQKLAVAPGIAVEVGDSYIQLIKNLVNWLVKFGK